MSSQAGKPNMKLLVPLVVLALALVLVNGRRHGLDKYDEEEEEEDLYERGIGKRSELGNNHQELNAHVKRKFVSLNKANKSKNKKRGKFNQLQNLDKDDEEENITYENNDAKKERRKQRTNIKRKFVKANSNSKLNEKRRELIRLLKKWLQVKK